MAITGTGGTVSFIDNRPLITGSQSGLDTAALIEAALTVKRLPAISLENKIIRNEGQIGAFADLNGLLEGLRAAIGALRNPPGQAGIASNVFERKSVFLSAEGDTVASEILGATADNSAAAGVHQILVDQIATAHKISSAAIADPAAAIGVTESLTIGLAGAAAEETFTLAVEAETSAADLVSAVNAQSGVTGIRAALITIAEDDTRLVFTAEKTNRAIELVGSSGATTAALGISDDNGASYNDVLQAAQGARIFVDGLATAIERDGNEIADVLPGVTLDLFKAAPGSAITLEIETDLTAVRQEINNFVEGYNAVRAFISAQQVVNAEGEVAETALLFGNNLLRGLSVDLGGDVSTLVGGLATDALSTLRDIGITLDQNNLLQVDDARLDAALVADAGEVRQVLEFGFQADSPTLSLIARNATLDVGSFTIAIPAGAIDGTNLQVAGADAFAVEGNVLRGLAGTAYEGMVLATARDTSDSGAAAENITITTTLGIAERLFQTVEAYTKPGSGLISEEVRRFEELNVDLRSQIDAIDQRLEAFQQTLIEKYAALERAIAQANAMAAQLRAFLETDDGS